MRIIAAVLGVCVLTGCTSLNMNDARDGAPTQILNSQKEAQKVAQCLQYSWQDEAMFGVTTDAALDSAAGSYTVYTTAAKYFADIKPVGAGSQISFYAREKGELAQRRLGALATCL